MERAYIDIDEKGNIIACATTPINESEIFIEVDNFEEFAMYTDAYKYVSGELILDPNKKQQIVDEEKMYEEQPSDKERIEALESAILEIVLGG